MKNDNLKGVKRLGLNESLNDVFLVLILAAIIGCENQNEYSSQRNSIVPKLSQIQLRDQNYQEKYKRIVFIGIDGLGTSNLQREISWNGVEAPEVPNLDMLKRTGAWTYQAKIDTRNFSGPNWMGMLTSSNSDLHGVFSNQDSRGFYIPTVFEVIRKQLPNAKMGVISDWPMITSYPWKDSESVRIISKDTDGVLTETLNFIEENTGFVFLFSYFGQVDEIGHEFGGSSLEYKLEVEKVDESIGQIIQRLKELYIWEETLIIITSDHGHQSGPTGHTSNGHPVPFIISAKNLNYGAIEDRNIHNNHVAVLITYSLGLKAAKKWEQKIHPFNLIF